MHIATAIEPILFAAALLLLFGIIVSKAATRTGIPALLLFLALGMLAGSEGVGGIYFDDAWLAQSVGVTALAFILFAGGFETNWPTIRPLLGRGISLATLGVMLTALIIGALAVLALGFSWREGLLLGAIVSSTDAAAVFSVLRARGVGLKKGLAPLIELESGSNDPMAVLLTLGLIRLLVEPSTSLVSLLLMFVRQIVVGALLGYTISRLSVLLINRLRLDYDGLYPVLSLTLVLFTYAATSLLGGNGFLAVYLAGLVLGQHDFIHKRSLMRFHDGLAWLMQIAMFLTLGLLVFPSRLIPIMGVGLLVSAVLIFVARPISVFLSLAAARMTRAEKALVSWVGLRGAAPIILATFPLVAGLPQADNLFNVVFFVVLTSVLIQGTTIPLVARWLGVAAPSPSRPGQPLEFAPTASLSSKLVDVTLPPTSAAVGKQIVDLRLPREALVVLLRRDDEYRIPHGGTLLQAGDTLTILVDKSALNHVRALGKG